MNYEEFLAYLNQNGGQMKFRTLGGRANFIAHNNNCKLYITNRNDIEYAVKTDIFRQVYDRFQASDEPNRYMTSQYTDPAWQDCPQRIICPYIAAIFREIEILNNNVPA